MNTFLILFAAIICTFCAAFVCTKIFTQPEKPNRSLQLDGLRGMLACAVITHHFCYNFNWREGGKWGATDVLIQNLGAVSVCLFFLMSAYLHIGKIQHSPKIKWRDFFIARIKCIYPLYIAVFLLVAAITLSYKPLTAQNLPEFLRFTLQWLLFQNASFQGFQAHLAIAGVQWTLVYEWAVYAILPLVYMIYQRKFSFQAAAWVAIGVAAWIIGWHSQTRYYWLFVLAIPAVILAQPIRFVMQKQPLVVHALMIALTVCAFAYTQPYSWAQRLVLMVWFGFVANGYSFANVLNYRGLTKLGDLSYAIYLLHGLVIFMWFGAWKMFAFKQGDFLGYVLHLPLIFSVAIGAAYLGNRYVEMPFSRKRKK